MWLYKEKEVTSISDMPDNTFGFIYQIIHLETDQFYIGRKNLQLKKTKKIGKKAQSLRTKNDDAIMALSIALLEYEPSGVSKTKENNSSMDWHNAFLRSISRGNQSTNLQKVTEMERAKLQSEILGGGGKNGVSISPYSSYRRPSNGFGFFGLDPKKLIR